jgi:uncharacterized protein YndB with AHSA1/START domain
MNIVKIILMVIAAIVVILLVAALMIKKEYTVEQEVIINQPRQKVFDYIKFLKNQDSYNKWVMMDPHVRKHFTGTDGTVGFIYAWDSDDKNVGQGEQEIAKITEGSRVDYDLRFIKPFKNTASAYIATEDAPGNSTKVIWGMHGQTPFPFNVMNLFIPGMLATDVKTSLDSLKRVLK